MCIRDSPFSVLNVFDGLMFDNYWFQTGTPTYLVDLLKQSDYDLRLLIDGLEVGSSGFAEYRAAVSYTHLRAHETRHDLVCRLLLEKKKKNVRD